MIFCPSQSSIIMVVGAGRGPLVHASIKAAEEAQKDVHVFAVEKNSNAVITLKSLQETTWNVSSERVTVISSDMREWKPEDDQKADIVVSELLGSFGDNELSPECLDGVWSYVKPSAISIPQEYSSYLVPISSHKLFSEAY